MPVDRMVEQPPWDPKPPPRAEDTFNDGRLIQDRMHQLLARALEQEAWGGKRLYWFCYLWGSRHNTPVCWLQWLEQEGYLTKNGFYGSYPEDGPDHEITAKGRMWLMQEGHKPK